MQVQQLINAINQLKGFDRTKNQEPKKKRTADENKKIQYRHQQDQ